MNDSNQECPADKSPSPPFRGEREGPNLPGWEGEVAGPRTSTSAPLTLPSAPRPAGGEASQAGAWR